MNADRRLREGLESVDELKTVYKDKIQKQRKAAAPPPPFPSPPPAPAPSVTSSSSLPFSALSRPSSPAGLKTLSSFLDLPKIRALPEKEIRSLWRLRFASSQTSLCGHFDKSIYIRIEAAARANPQFVLPLPQEGKGNEIHFLQWSFPAPDTATVIFTRLAEYQLKGEFSQPHTTITVHSELLEEKGLALMQGEVVDGKGINPDQAWWLVYQMEKFYEGGEKRKKLLEAFTRGDGDFKIDDLIAESEYLQ